MISESASGEQLRRLWQNMKTRQRDALTRERQHRMATGGGGPCPDADINPDIAEICPALFVEIQDTLDSDCNDYASVSDQHQETLTKSNLSHAIYTATQPLQDVESAIQTNSIIQPRSTIQPSSTIQPISTIQPSSIIQPSSTIQESSTIQPRSTVHENSTIQPRNTVQESSTIQPRSTVQPDTELSSNEKKLRVQILKQEHINREKEQLIYMSSK